MNGELTQIKSILIQRLNGGTVQSHEALDSLIRLVRGLPNRPDGRSPYAGILGDSWTYAKVRDLINGMDFSPMLNNLQFHNLFRQVIGQPEVQTINWESLGIKPQKWTNSQYAQFFGRILTQEQITDIEKCYAEMGSLNEWHLFLSQIHHESGGLRWLVELADGWAYEGRRDLGNTQPGDGPKFRGGGALQTTGRFNYQKLADYTRDKEVMNQGATYVARVYPFLSSMVWWRANNMKARIAGGLGIEGVSQAVNGKHPANGLADRINQYNRAKSIFR